MKMTIIMTSRQYNENQQQIDTNSLSGNYTEQIPYLKAAR